jgi:Phage regulatory protein CII (CP76)
LLPKQAEKRNWFLPGCCILHAYLTPNSPAAQLQFCTYFIIVFALAIRRGLFQIPAMQSYELLHEVFQKNSPQQVADDLDLSVSMVYKWAQPPTAGSGIANPLDRVEALLQSTGDHRIVQWLCQRAGGFFIQNPKSLTHPHYLIPATNQIVQEFADLLHVIAKASSDNEVTQTEAKQIRARWEELKSVTEGFVASCEQGNFDHIRNHAARRAAATQPARV